MATLAEMKARHRQGVEQRLINLEMSAARIDGRLPACKMVGRSALETAYSWPDPPPDPRPDLTADSPPWVRLLAMAYAVDGEDPEGLYGALAGLRCCGARLVSEVGKVKLTAGDLGDEYPALRDRWLLPHKDTLLQALASLVKQPARGAP